MYLKAVPISYDSLSSCGKIPFSNRTLALCVYIPFPLCVCNTYLRFIGDSVEGLTFLVHVLRHWAFAEHILLKPCFLRVLHLDELNFNFLTIIYWHTFLIQFLTYPSLNWYKDSIIWRKWTAKIRLKVGRFIRGPYGNWI